MGVSAIIQVENILTEKGKKLKSVICDGSKAINSNTPPASDPSVIYLFIFYFIL